MFVIVLSNLEIESDKAFNRFYNALLVYKYLPIAQK